MTGTARHRGRRVRQHLRPPGRADPDAPSRWSAIDQADLIYKTEDAKFDAVVDDLAERYETGQPVLVGTISVEKSEKLVAHAREAGHPPRGAQRQAAHPGGGDRRPGRPPRTRSRWPPTWPAAASTSSSAATPRAWPSATCAPRGSTSRADEGQARLAELRPKYKAETEGRGRQGPRARRPLRARHRAPREPPHRQPAAWPLRPPGRSRREPLLPVARGRAHAPVRHRRHELGDGQGPARRRADRGEDGHQGHRAGAEHRRAAQRRDPQERPQVRRGDERAAQGHLQAPRPDPRRRRPARGGARVPRRGRRRRRSARTASPTSPRSGTSTGLHHRAQHVLAHRRSPSRTSAGCGTTDELYELLMGEATGYYEQREEELGAETDARGRAPGDAAASSTSTGASTSTRWTTSRRASTCGPWARRTRSSSGSARASRCSAQMMHGDRPGLREVRHARRRSCVASEPPSRAGGQRHARTRRPRTRPSAGGTMVDRGAGRRRRPRAARSAGRGGAQAEDEVVNTPVVKSDWDKTPRNAPCPCGQRQEVQALPRRAERERTHAGLLRRPRGASRAPRRGRGLPEASTSCAARRPQLETEASRPDLWDDPDAARKVTGELVGGQRRPRLYDAPRRTDRRRRDAGRARPARRTTTRWRPRSTRRSTSLGRELRRARAARRCSPASTTSTTRSARSSRARAAPTPRTGPRCCCACTCAGPSGAGFDVELDEVSAGPRGRHHARPRSW